MRSNLPSVCGRPNNLWSFGLHVLFFFALGFVSYIALRHIDQPLIDSYAFRQTQTALTAYWILEEGLTLAYQTPVMGAPWAVPFEFPIYQAIVAALAGGSGLSLEAIGRAVSYFFLIGCALPAFALGKRLKLPSAVPEVFCILLWTSPLYVYWGRTFMIETAALFFALASVPYAIDLLRGDQRLRTAVMFLSLASASVLQKSTTGGPLLLFLLVSGVFPQLRGGEWRPDNWGARWYALMLIGLPLVVGWLWAHYADAVKMLNPFGSQLTSRALPGWIFGTIQQRLDPETWRLVVWERSFGWNAGGFFGVALLLIPWLVGRNHRRFAWLSLAAASLFLLPIVIFFNLHVVHEYYQVGCVAYLLGALAIVIGGWVREASGHESIVLIATTIIVISNLLVFNNGYGIVVARSVDEMDPRSVQLYRVGQYLRKTTRPDTGIVVFGSAYSSEVAFHSQRKAMTVPPWFKSYSDVWAKPSAFLGDTVLGAIVICPSSDTFPKIEGFPGLKDVQERVAEEPWWIHRSVQGCEVLISPQGLAGESPGPPDILGERALGVPRGGR